LDLVVLLDCEHVHGLEGRHLTLESVQLRRDRLAVRHRRRVVRAHLGGQLVDLPLEALSLFTLCRELVFGGGGLLLGRVAVRLGIVDARS
jgi:hypothetical protein